MGAVQDNLFSDLPISISNASAQRTSKYLGPLATWSTDKEVFDPFDRHLEGVCSLYFSVRLSYIRAW